ncbi:acid-sensing ion channel 1C-like isoform X4 [Solea senegalensis]|uniref:Acid-sensing ion channel 1C-like isoform X4 n=1 Tax=Solea senegalensis TaxID=28829 RepID=A0AAV6T6X2_SOLSE|nr:acid-sensing ion channel 1C-like isoform X4 [Solea senegalensis]
MKGSSEESIESVRPSNLQAFANISTLHGMSHIFAYGHMTFRRFLWTLSFLGSLCLLMIVCLDRVSYYLEYPHVTKLDEVAAANLTFPAITFCNLNEFRFSKITRNDLYHVGELLALLNSNYQIANPHLAEPEVLAALKDKANFQNFKPKLFNMTDFYNRTGHDISEMLLQCTFRGEECYPVNFSTIYTRYGKCYTFNSGLDGNPLLTTLKGGTGNGLEIMLDIQQDEYLPVWGETDETSYEAGIKVQIHSQSEPPFIDQLGFGVAPGFQTFVSCQQQLFLSLVLFPDHVSRALADILRQQGPIPISQYDCENFAAMNGSPKDNTPVRTSSKNHYTPVHSSKSNHGLHYGKESVRSSGGGGGADFHNFISSGFVTLGRGHQKGKQRPSLLLCCCCVVFFTQEPEPHGVFTR